MIELGANWIHGARPGNPIYDIVVDGLHLAGHEEEDAGYEVRWPGETEAQSLDSLSRNEELQEALESVEEISLALPKGQDMSMREALAKCGWSPASDLDRALEWLACDYEYAESPDTTRTYFQTNFG